MDFLACFTSFVSHDENFEQANQQLEELNENDPIQFLRELLEITTNSAVDDRMRLNALRILSLPAGSTCRKKADGFGRNRLTDIPDELIDDVLNVLIGLFGASDEVSKAAQGIFVYYGEKLPTPKMNEVIGKICQLISGNEAISKEMLKIYFTVMKDITNPYWRLEIEECRPVCMALLENRTDLDDELVELILRLIIKTITSDYNQEANEESAMLLQFALNYVEKFPKTAADLIARLRCRNFEEVFPTFPETLFSIISSGSEYGCFFQFIPHPSAPEFCYFIGEHLTDYISIALAVLGQNSTIQIDSEEDKYYPNHIVSYFIQNLIYSRNLNLYDDFRSYVTEHIAEEGTAEKYSAAIINNFLRTYRNDAGLLIYDINQTEVVNCLITDQNQVIFREGMKLIYALLEMSYFDNTSKMIMNSQDSQGTLDNPEGEETQSQNSQEQANPLRIELTEELFQLIIDCYSSPSESIKDLSQQILTIIAQNHNEAVMTQVFATFLEVIEDPEDKTDQQITEALDMLKSSSFALNSEQSAEIASSLFSTITELFESNPLDVHFGDYIQFFGQVFNKGSQHLEEALPSIYSFIQSLLEGDKEDEGMYLLVHVINKFGKDDPELLQFGKEIISAKLGDADNEDNLESMVNLCSTILRQSPEVDSEFENLIIENTIQYIQAPIIKKNTKSRIITTYSIINEHTPELIAAKAVILFDYMTQDFSLGFCYQPNVDVTLTVLKNLTKEEIGTPKQLKTLIQNCVTNYANKISFRYFKNGQFQDNTQQKQEFAFHVLELLEIADYFELTGEIKVWDSQYETIKDSLPEEYLPRFMELQPPPEPPQSQ